MKIYLDDCRECPNGWILAKTADECIEYLKTGKVTALSLDHDLGEEPTDHAYTDIHGYVGDGLREGKTGYTVVEWMISNNVFPEHIAVHSMNPVGRKKMLDALERYNPVYMSAPKARVDDHVGTTLLGDEQENYSFAHGGSRTSEVPIDTDAKRTREQLRVCNAIRERDGLPPLRTYGVYGSASQWWVSGPYRKTREEAERDLDALERGLRHGEAEVDYCSLAVRWLDAHDLDKPGRGLRGPLTRLLESTCKQRSAGPPYHDRVHKEGKLIADYLLRTADAQPDGCASMSDHGPNFNSPCRDTEPSARDLVKQAVTMLRAASGGWGSVSVKMDDGTWYELAPQCRESASKTSEVEGQIHTAGADAHPDSTRLTADSIVSWLRTMSTWQDPERLADEIEDMGLMKRGEAAPNASDPYDVTKMSDWTGDKSPLHTPCPAAMPNGARCIGNAGHPGLCNSVNPFAETPSSGVVESPLADWIPFSKLARYENIIKAARAVVSTNFGVEPLCSLRQSLDALDADWPKDAPGQFTSPAKEKP